MISTARYVLGHLAEGAMLTRARFGWSLTWPYSVAFEAVETTTVQELLSRQWAARETDKQSVPFYYITNAGRAALEETCADQTS